MHEVPQTKPLCSKMSRGKRDTTLRKAVDDMEDDTEIFQVSNVKLDESQFVTLELESGNYMRFQADTGAQCNVVPVELYKKATKDLQLAKVTPTKSRITAYGGTTLPVVGTVLLRVRRGDLKCRLDCKLVDCSDVRPLLGRIACLGLKIVAYLDNDQLNKPNTGDSTVYTLEGTGPISTEQFINKYPKVFSDGVGLLEGSYHIRLDPPCSIHVPVPLRDTLKATLEGLVKQDIITPVTEPTPWISSMVVVPKKNGILRICLDPKEPSGESIIHCRPLKTLQRVFVERRCSPEQRILACPTG